MSELNVIHRPAGALDAHQAAASVAAHNPVAPRPAPAQTIGAMSLLVDRRSFLRTASAGLAGLPILAGPLAARAADAPASASASASAVALPEPSARKLPRWRGFNLLEKFTARRNGNPGFREADFQWMHEWGFDFARLPMSYQCWAKGDPAAWRQLDEAQLKHVDEAVEFGRRHGVHVNLNLHRAPGYCVNPPAEPLDLFRDQEALDACAFHWAHFARRYRGIPNTRLSFDLLNEPKDLPDADYARVVKVLVEAIRAEDPGRLIVADGLKWGRKPVPSLAGLGIAQSTRGYDPMRVSHHQASWVNGQNWPEPAWPLNPDGKDRWDKERLRREIIQPWKDLEAQGVGVHVGEWGAFHRCPHAVALAWMKDFLDLWREAGWGWALWNFRGSFGILDSERADVAYEDFRGAKLDRRMLELLRAG